MRKRSAFTLLELLVVVGMISLLCALLLPALNSAWASARRVADLGNLKKLTQACRQYAIANNGYLPLGDRTGSSLAANNDDLIWINYNTFGYFAGSVDSPTAASNWQSGQVDPSVQYALACTSMATNGDSLAAVGLQDYKNDAFGGTSGDGGSTYMGYIYWGRRNISRAGPIYTPAGVCLAPAVNYVFPTRLSGRATSATLISCPGWIGPSYGGELPHARPGNGFLIVGDQGSPSAPIANQMTGLGIGYTDGHAEFVPRSDLWSMWEGFEWVYFDNTQ